MPPTVRQMQGLVMMGWILRFDHIEGLIRGDLLHKVSKNQIKVNFPSKIVGNN